ncbi:unnamed protein product, partial [Brenthis ino]
MSRVRPRLSVITVYLVRARPPAARRLALSPASDGERSGRPHLGYVSSAHSDHDSVRQSRVARECPSPSRQLGRYAAGKPAMRRL